MTLLSVERKTETSLCYVGGAQDPKLIRSKFTILHTCSRIFNILTSFYSIYKNYKCKTLISPKSSELGIKRVLWFQFGYLPSISLLLRNEAWTSWTSNLKEKKIKGLSLHTYISKHAKTWMIFYLLPASLQGDSFSFKKWS